MTITDEQIKAAEDENPTPLAALDDLAYLIFTSGSTGRPKGAVASRANLQSHIAEVQHRLALTETSHILSTARFNFDANVIELLPGLCAGGTVELAQADLQNDADALLNWVATRDTDVVFLTTPLAELAMQTNRIPLSARVVVAGGDRLSTPPPADAHYHLSNNYGPTETTVVAIGAVIAPGAQILPIGRPVAK